MKNLNKTKKIQWKKIYSRRFFMYSDNMKIRQLVDKCDGGPIGEVPKAIRARMNLAQRASQVSVGTKTSSQLVIF